MMPIAVAVLAAAQVKPGHTDGFAGALAMGIAGGVLPAMRASRLSPAAAMRAL